jgi:hypothetical protein
METYEVFSRRSAPNSDRLLEALLDRRVAFVEIQLSDKDADILEQVSGARLPFVKLGKVVVGGFSELVNRLRFSPARPRHRPAPVC